MMLIRYCMNMIVDEQRQAFFTILKANIVYAFEFSGKTAMMFDLFAFRTQSFLFLKLTLFMLLNSQVE